MLHSNFLICIQGGNGLEILGNGAMKCSKGPASWALNWEINTRLRILDTVCTFNKMSFLRVKTSLCLSICNVLAYLMKSIAPTQYRGALVFTCFSLFVCIFVFAVFLDTESISLIVCVLFLSCVCFVLCPPLTSAYQQLLIWFLTMLFGAVLPLPTSYSCAPPHHHSLHTCTSSTGGSAIK